MNNGSICGQLIMTFSFEHFSLGTASLSHETCSNVKRGSSTESGCMREKGDTCFTGSTVVQDGIKEKKKKKALLEILVALQSSLCNTFSTPKYFCTSVFKSMYVYSSVHKTHWNLSEGKTTCRKGGGGSREGQGKDQVRRNLLVA